MGGSYLTTVTGTPSSSTGYTLVETLLVKEYLASREFVSPLANSQYISKRNMPKMVGQSMKLTRRKPLREPEGSKETTDPLSYGSQTYEQLLIPVEWINDHYALSQMAQDTGWIDLAEDCKEGIFEAMRRYRNRSVQAAMLGGRYKPGYRNSSGVTIDGDTTYPSPWYEEENPVTLYGGSYTFLKFAKRYAGGGAEFADLDGSQRATMNDVKRLVVGLKNRGAITFDGGKYVMVISDAVKADLENDDKYFAAAIRNQAASTKVFAGEIADYAGVHFVTDDEPWTMKIGGNGVSKAANNDGEVHVCQIFGKDSASYVTLGGKGALRPTFKVQNISTTGKLTTIGYNVPNQNVVTNGDWGFNYLCCPQYFNA